MSPAVANALILTLRIYSFVILARVVMTWFIRDPRHPLVRLVSPLTDPVLIPLSRILTFGGIDLSPLAVLIGLQLLQRVIAGAV